MTTFDRILAEFIEEHRIYIVYKLTTPTNNGKFKSYLYDGPADNNSANILNYAIEEITIPKMGAIFAFSSLEAALEYAGKEAIKEGYYVIFKSTAGKYKNNTELRMCASEFYSGKIKKELKYFWGGKIKKALKYFWEAVELEDDEKCYLHNNFKYQLSGTFLCSCLKPIERIML